MKKVIYSLAIGAFLMCGTLVINNTFLSKDKEIQHYGLGGSEREPGVLSIKSTTL